MTAPLPEGTNSTTSTAGTAGKDSPNSTAGTSVLLRGKTRLDGFGLATVEVAGRPEPAMVLGEQVLDLRQAARSAGLKLSDEPCFGLLDLLEDWPRAFDCLLELAAAVQRTGVLDERWQRFGAGTRVLPPVTRPSKMIHAAQNYADHVAEMRAAQRFGFNDVQVDVDFTGDKDGARPYLFLKAPSCLAGAYDDVVLQPEVTQLDWEVELAVVIGRRASRVSATTALTHVAGYMTTNDLSARNLLFRPDRERLRSDWFGGKSHDGYAPTGPLLVPAAFVADHLNLPLRLSVNGEVRQNGSTAGLIFSPAEQIEYASHIMTLLPGDVLATGTPGGVGQGTNEFLQPGDIVEAEVAGLGILRNRIVAASKETDSYA